MAKKRKYTRRTKSKSITNRKTKMLKKGLSFRNDIEAYTKKKSLSKVTKRKLNVQANKVNNSIKVLMNTKL